MSSAAVVIGDLRVKETQVVPHGAIFFLQQEAIFFVGRAVIIKVANRGHKSFCTLNKTCPQTG